MISLCHLEGNPSLDKRMRQLLQEVGVWQSWQTLQQFFGGTIVTTASFPGYSATGLGHTALRSTDAFRSLT